MVRVIDVELRPAASFCDHVHSCVGQTQIQTWSAVGPAHHILTVALQSVDTCF